MPPEWDEVRRWLEKAQHDRARNDLRLPDTMVVDREAPSVDPTTLFDVCDGDNGRRTGPKQSTKEMRGKKRRR